MQAGWLSRVVIVLAALALILGLSSQAKAQVAGARISGTISDSTGAVVPNSSISIKDVDTGVSHDVTADGQGFYSIPNIPPGNYTMEIRAEGFSTQARAGLVLTVGEEQQLNFTMQVGQVNQVVQVTGAAPAVDVTSSEISAVVEQAAIVELPLNGRSWTDLTVLQRGVSYIETASSPYSGPSRGCIRGCGAQLSIAGGRPQQNLYRMDGFSINDQYNASPGSGAHGLNLGVDAIKEFSVVTQPTAEYGNVSGGVVNAVTKSGTNSFHGGAYEFLRNSALDARNPVDPAVIPPFRRNQFGADGGFPIRKDKTFAFFDYEGLRETLTNTVLDKVPSANAHMGILSTGNVTVNANIVPALPLWPTPNDGLITPDQGLWSFASRTQTDENYYITRIDHHFSAKDTISGTYMGDIAHQTMPDAFDLELIGVRTDRQIGTIEWTHILSPALVNVVRIGGFHNASSNGIPAGVINPLAANSALATVPGIGGMGSVAISGGYTGNPGGVGSTLFRIDNWNTYQVYDDAFLTKGLHSIKFGYMFVRNQSNATNSTSPGGAWTFPSLSAFLQDQPSALTAQFPNFLSPRHERVSIHGVYIQDEWRFRPNLTINMGLRYEMSTVPTETDGKNADIDNITDGQSMVRVGAPLWINPTRENFEPRLGFAWDPRGSGKSSVRASFGIYDVLPLTYEIGSHITQAYPFFELGTSTSPAQLKGTFPTTGFAVLQNLNTAAFQQIFFQHNPKRNYVMQWNLDLQHQLTPNLTVALGYVGSHTNHNVFNDREADQVIPTLTSAGWLYPNPIGSGTKINPAWGSIKAVWWASEASYNGMIASVTKRLSRSFQVQGSFTWSKSLDDSSSSQEGNGFANSLGNEDWWAGTLRSEYYGPSDFNIGRTLIINAIWNIPGLHSSFEPATWATTGWEMGGIFRANDGPPFSATYGTGADPAGTLSSLSLGYPDVLTGTPGCDTLTNPGNPKNYVKTQCFTLPTAPNMSYWTANCSPSKGYPICLNLRGDVGRNIMNGPGLVSLDFSMVKNNNIKKISENFNLQFRAEVFNSLNHPNWDPPTTTDVLTGAGAATGIGTLTATATNSRQIQFGLKMAW